MLEVSDYLKDGGYGGDEWPWKVMIDSTLKSDKWISQHNTGWIMYLFDKPVVIQAYGLESGNDCPDRDPKDWTFQIKDAVKIIKDG